MPIILRVEAVNVQGTPHFLEHPAYVKAFDVEAYDGRGHVETTADPEEAMKWDTAKDAMHAWNTQSKIKPLREDGRPNKPLTAMTVEIINHGKATHL